MLFHKCTIGDVPRNRCGNKTDVRRRCNKCSDNRYIQCSWLIPGVAKNLMKNLVMNEKAVINNYLRARRKYYSNSDFKWFSGQQLDKFTIVWEETPFIDLATNQNVSYWSNQSLYKEESVVTHTEHSLSLSLSLTEHTDRSVNCPHCNLATHTLTAFAWLNWLTVIYCSIRNIHFTSHRL